MCNHTIPIHIIENFTCSNLMAVRNVGVIKRENYFVDDSVTVDGDAPKKFIGVYDYSLMEGRHKKNRSNWIRYIAKTGSKWYPIESVTELLMNELADIFGLTTAESRLAMIGGQLRFLSRYFLNPQKEELVHGADILAGYLNDSPKFVEEVDKEKLTSEWFTLQFVDDAVSNMFLYKRDDIMHELSKLVIFDALVGNNDRHFFNWGVIRSIDGSFQPVFSPIYDTARGLFWNYSEEKIYNIIEVNKQADAHVAKYCKDSRPKIGWEGVKKLKHFELFEKIYSSEYYITKDEIKALLQPILLDKMILHVNQKYCHLMSKNRIMMICKCLEYRFNELQKYL